VSWEATNLLTVAATLVAAAYARQETRGCHWREDHPEASPSWLGHIVGCVAADGIRRQQWEVW
jgi:L-aspartate oxidase